MTSNGDTNLKCTIMCDDIVLTQTDATITALITTSTKNTTKTANIIAAK